MIINWIRRTVRDIERRTWLVIVLVVLVLFVFISLPSQGGTVSLPAFQATLDAASTQNNIPYPTMVAQLSQTPFEAIVTHMAPTVMLQGFVEIRQFAASAHADNERDHIYWSAAQATGPANTDKCGDTRTAWSTLEPTSLGTLNLYFAQLVRPTEVRVHQSFNPGFITRIDLIDIYGKIHTVFESVPQTNPQCPFVLVIPVKDADYPTNTVTVYIDQSGSVSGWDQIDAVELIGTAYN
jgi:hypothetical protein